MLHRITRNFLRFVELPAGLHIRLESRLLLRLSHHLLGVFLPEEGVGFALRECTQFFGLRGLRGCEGVGLESTLHVRGDVCEALSTDVEGPPGIPRAPLLGR
jgi:hypothetical protein